MKILLGFIAVFFVVSTMNGQVEQFERAGDQLFGMNYHISLPSGELNDFIENTSFRGFSFDYEKFLNKKISVGGHIGWSIFHEETDKETFNFGADQGFANTAGAINAKLWKYTHVIPIEVKAKYYYNAVENAPGRMFFGAGLGTSYVNQEVWVGQTEFKQDNWYFSFYPELGFDFNVSGNSHFQFAGQFNNVVNGHFGEDMLNFWSLKAGFFWRID